MVKRRRLIRLTSVLLVFSLLFTFHANAYMSLGKKLIGGVENRTYFIENSTYIINDPINPGAIRVIDYGSYIRLAVKNWNDAVNNENKFERTANVAFTETTDRSKATVIFSVLEYGNTGWYGKAFFSKDGVSVSADSTGVPTKDYDKVTIGLNVSNTYTFDSTLMALAGHEFGHALGLGHWSNKPYTIMHPDVFTAAATPQADDILGIHKLYSK